MQTNAFDIRRTATTERKSFIDFEIRGSIMHISRIGHVPYLQPEEKSRMKPEPAQRTAFNNRASNRMDTLNRDGVCWQYADDQSRLHVVGCG